MIQIGTVEIRERDEPVEIVERDPAIPKGQKALFAQLAQHTIDMDRAEAQSIGQ